MVLAEGGLVLMEFPGLILPHVYLVAPMRLVSLVVLLAEQELRAAATLMDLYVTLTLTPTILL